MGDRLADWNRIKISCDELVLSDQRDVIVWNLTKNGLFSVKSFYKALKLQETSAGVRESYKIIWKIKVPLKVRIFMWLLIKGNVLTKDNLIKRGWKKGNDLCQFCEQKETIQHMFLECPVVRFTWNIVICAFNMKLIKDLKHMLSSWIQTCDKTTKQLMLVGVAAVIWAIWKARNKACFDHVLPNSPMVIYQKLYHSCSNIKPNIRQRLHFPCQSPEANHQITHIYVTALANRHERLICRYIVFFRTACFSICKSSASC